MRRFTCIQAGRTGTGTGTGRGRGRGQMRAFRLPLCNAFSCTPCTLQSNARGCPKQGGEGREHSRNAVGDRRDAEEGEDDEGKRERQKSRTMAGTGQGNTGIHLGRDRHTFFKTKSQISTISREIYFSMQHATG